MQTDPTSDISNTWSNHAPVVSASPATDASPHVEDQPADPIGDVAFPSHATADTSQTQTELAEGDPGAGTHSGSEGDGIPLDAQERRGDEAEKKRPRHRFTWSSAVAQKLFAQIERVAVLESTVLLAGESGTGKTAIARMIHERSLRTGKRFVAINCASLPRDLIDAELFGHARGAFTGAVEERMGRAEFADGGTLFLDEVGDLPLELQPKLLTFLQDRRFHRIGCNQQRESDVRIIAATHRDLLELAEEGEFRRDLFFRLAVLRVDVPSLRERRDEIRNMCREILQRICRERNAAPIRVDSLAMEALINYPWPGNIRELENVLENASAFCHGDIIRIEDLNLPSGTVGDSGRRAGHPQTVMSLAGKTLAEIEKRAIVETLESLGGNKAKSARSLGISEKSIYNKMRRHGLQTKKTRHDPQEHDDLGSESGAF